MKKTHRTAGLDQLNPPMPTISYLHQPWQNKWPRNETKGWRRQLANHRAWATRKKSAAVTLPSFRRGED